MSQGSVPGKGAALVTFDLSSQTVTLQGVSPLLARASTGLELLLCPETGRTLAMRVLLTAEQQFRSAKPGWRPVMWVEAWGDGRPFSLGPDARAIHEVAPPEAQLKAVSDPPRRW